MSNQFIENEKSPILEIHLRGKSRKRAKSIQKDTPLNQEDLLNRIEKRQGYRPKLMSARFQEWSEQGKSDGELN